MSTEPTKQKIKKSLVSKTKIAKLLGLSRTKFYVKLEYDDFSAQEIKTMKDNGVIK